MFHFTYVCMYVCRSESTSILNKVNENYRPIVAQKDSELKASQQRYVYTYTVCMYVYNSIITYVRKYTFISYYIVQLNIPQVKGIITET